MSTSCPNCSTCTCTGSYLMKAFNGTQVCSRCVNMYNQVHPIEQVVVDVIPQIKNPVKTKH